MLRAAPRERLPWRRLARVAADAAALPLAAGSVDVVFSNLMLQWCDEPLRVFAEIQRVLRPGGLLLFSTFGPDTLGELRAAWAQADDAAHVSDFPDMQSLGSALMQAGLNEPVMDTELHRLLYTDAYALMRELKRLGATNAARARTRGLIGRARLERMLKAYEQQRTASGLTATFEVIVGVAFAGERRREGEQVISLQSLRRRVGS
jgi:malonyl-CoA O-methyltransferase